LRCGFYKAERTVTATSITGMVMLGGKGGSTALRIMNVWLDK
jgi:hypothetical protein